MCFVHIFYYNLQRPSLKQCSQYTRCKKERKKYKATLEEAKSCRLICLCVLFDFNRPVFKESAPRQNLSVSPNVRLCVVCCMLSLPMQLISRPLIGQHRSHDQFPGPSLDHPPLSFDESGGNTLIYSMGLNSNHSRKIWQPQIAQENIVTHYQITLFT